MVEWKKLGEIGTFTRGNGLQKADFVDSGFPCIHYGQIYTRYGLSTNKTITYCSKELAKKLVKAKTGDMIIACTSENIEDVCKAVVWLGEGEVATGGHSCVFSHNQDPKYVAYFFQTEQFFMQKKKYANGVKVIDIKAVDLAKISIPIPSISEQSHIVSILDTFTSSISNLKQQIEERRKQYEYERDLLLDLEGKEGVEMKKLGEMFSFKNGLNKGKEFFGKGKPIIMFTNVFNSRFITKAMIKSRVDISEQELERINAQIGDVFFTRTSETKEDVGYASVLVEDMEECTFAGFLIRARPITHKMLPQYCKYCFSTPKVRNAIVSKSSFTTRASLTGSGLGEVIIPLPPLSTQSRIVSILDTFEQSIANLEEQLAMREKQYEYYRNQLLTFEGEEERGKT